MCVLPAKSVLAALPASLAHLIVLAETMEEDHDQQQQRRTSSRQQQQQLRLQQQGGHMSKAARKQARKARKAATAARVEGLQGLDVLAALGNEVEPTAAEKGSSSPTAADGGNSEDGSEHFEDNSSKAAAAAVGGFSHLLSDDAELSMLRLAQELCVTFPNNVEQLVDLTGEGHTAGGDCACYVRLEHILTTLRGSYPVVVLA